ncbi:hypothetical protein [Algibacter aquimarinus]|uniref:Uncharacterized protein n=1 Tax=Algibacter aquimarinus TaxID=1136748 RepID=A0ABP9H3C1_9FLAO
MKNENLNNIKTPGFKTPDNYFESFDDVLLNKLKTEKTLNTVKTTGFKTKKDYFDNLEDKILNKLSKKNDTKVISLVSRKTIIYVSSIAAAILLLFNLSIFGRTTETFDNLETETVENYIIDENISSYEIAALLTQEQIEENITIDYSIDEDNIQEFLINNADIEDLMVE